MSTFISPCHTYPTTTGQHPGLPDKKHPHRVNGVTAAEKVKKTAAKAAREAEEKEVKEKNDADINDFECAKHLHEELDDRTLCQAYIAKTSQEDNSEIDVEETSSDFKMTDKLNPDKQTYQPSRTPTEDESSDSATKDEGTTKKKRMLYSTVAKVGMKHGKPTAAQGPTGLNQGVRLPSSSKSKLAMHSDNNTTTESNSSPPPAVPQTPASRSIGARKLVQGGSNMLRPEPKVAPPARDKSQSVARPKARAAPLVRSETLLVPGHYEPRIAVMRPKKLTTKTKSQVKSMKNSLLDGDDDMVDIILSNSNLPAPSHQLNSKFSVTYSPSKKLISTHQD